MNKYLKIFLFFMIIFLTPSVFAQDFNVTSIIRAPTTNASNGTYRGTEIYNTGLETNYNVNTRYDGRLSRIRFWVNLPSNWPDGDCFSVGDLNYRLTVNMATDDFRNNFTTPFISNNANTTNWVTSWSYVSMKKIYINFTIPNTTTCYDKIFVDLKSTNVSSVAITGVSNWNLSNVTLTAYFPTLVTPTPTPVTTSTPTPRPDSTNQDIINNQNSNTNNIINNQNSNTNNIINNQNSNTNSVIDNQNQNTSDIIDNNNANTQDLIDNNNANLTCPSGPHILSSNFAGENGWLNSSGEIISPSANDIVTEYLLVKPNTEYTITFSGASSSSSSYCLYKQNKGLISCSPYGGPSKVTFTTTSSTTYLRFTISLSRTMSIQGPICNDFAIEEAQKTNQKLDDINNSINNDNLDNGVGSGFFSDFEDNQHGLTGIITAPLNAIERLTSSTCQPLQLPIPFTNSNVSLPCMTQVYQERIPTIYNIWKVVSFGIIAYFICIDIFHIVKGFKDPESDKVEVLDL